MRYHAPRRRASYPALTPCVVTAGARFTMGRSVERYLLRRSYCSYIRTESAVILCDIPVPSRASL